MRVRVSRRAGSQVRAMVRFIASDSPRAAMRISTAIEQAFALLQDFPEIGIVGQNGVTREWVVRGAPCVVLYDIDVDRQEIQIQSVYHSAQDRSRG